MEEKMIEKFLILSALILPSVTHAANSQKCFDTYSEAAEFSVKDKMWFDQLEFKTADITTVAGKTIVIKNGVPLHTGDVMLVSQTFSPNGSKAVVTSKFKVLDNNIVESSHCASQMIEAI